MPRLSFQSIVGWVDTIDSLAAVKYLVFDQKKYTMAQLCDAIKADWEGYDEMRKDFKNAPKFGNDNDLADDIMIRATKDVYDIARTIKDERGDYGVYPNALPISWIFMAAPAIGALPNGRKRGEALCDGGINPQAEFDLSGPWARMNSAMKVDQTKFKAYIYNQKIDYPSVEGEAGLNKLVDFVLAGLNGGMAQMQFNFVSRDMLQDAKKQPEKYPYLSVRVSGYTAFFVGLPEFMQDAVMERVDHNL
jgi:pyruvate-formate lyase